MESARSEEQLSQQVTELRTQIHGLKEQVETVQRERDELQRQLSVGAEVKQIRVPVEEAELIARGRANPQDWRVSHVSQAEFMLRNPDRWVAVWVFERGECPRCSRTIVDAFTGDILNATNAPTGQ